MSTETLIEFSAWIITAILLLTFTPKNKIRHAFVIFFFKQLMTWLFGLLVAEFGLIEYPIRFFANATKTSFTFEFFIYPAICVLFNLYYPWKKGFLGQFMYYAYYCSAMTFIEALLEKHTNLIVYTHWSWYLTWITLFLTFFASNKFYVWFYQLKPKN